MARKPIAAVIAALIALVSLTCAASALADAPDPIPANTHGIITVNNDGSRTLTVWGGSWVGDPAGTTANGAPAGTIVTPGWQWTTHSSDCNTDRAGAGYSIVWNDGSQQGNLIDGGNLGDFYVGAAFANAFNPADNTVHSTPIQNIPGAVNHDVATPTDPLYKEWRGGCGIQVNHLTPVQLPNGTSKTGKWNEGVWGPISHTYPSTNPGPYSICPVMYDVHGSDENTPPNGVKEITAGGTGHNGDNSIQSNGSTPQGNGCFKTNFASPHLVIIKKVSKDGGASWFDSVTVHANAPVKYQFTVINDGDQGTTLTSVHVNELTQLADCDATLHAVSGSSTLAPGGSAVFECSHTMGSTDQLNTATASGTYTPSPGSPSQGVTSEPDSAEVLVLRPSFLISKSVNPTGTVHVGDDLNYSIKVSNTGNSDLTFTLKDIEKGTNNAGCDQYAPSTPAVFTIVQGGPDRILTCVKAAPNQASYTNQACATAVDEIGSQLPQQCGDVTNKIAHPGFKVTKSVDKAKASVGDTLHYTINAINTGDVALTVSNFDDHVKGLGISGCDFAPGQPPASFTLNANTTRSFFCSHVVAPGDPTPYTNVACFDATDNLTITPKTFSECGETTTEPADPNLQIVKTVDKATALDNETLTYTIVVTNTGRATASNVQVTDLIAGTGHSCGTLIGPSQGGSLAPGASITYACVYTAAHGDEDATHHIVNTATVNATNENGQPLPPKTSSASTAIKHPAIAIDKTGPATAQAGDKVSYTLTVTNPGDVSFTEANVQVNDPQCNGDPVTLVGKGGDTSTGSFDPGDVWTYTCSVQTQVGDTAIHNVATVTGSHPPAPPVSDNDDADTTLTAPEQLVLPERVTPGAAKLAGPTGCVSKAFNAKVRGTKMATAVFVLDGKIVKRVKVGAKQGLVQLRVNPANFKVGVHRLVVNVTFRSGSGTKPKTMRLSFQRCAKKLTTPRFTG